MPKRLSLRVLCYGAIALAVLGLIALWVAARKAKVPVIRVQDVGKTMNWAYVKLEGTVIRPPAYDVQSDDLKFWIYDGTGEIMVVAYGNESRALIDAGQVPAIGDRVTVEGTLKIKEDFQSLTLNVPEHVVVERPAPVEMAIGDIRIEHIYHKVQVRGQVRQVRVPYEGLVVLVVRDETGEIDVTYTADLVRLGGEPAQVAPGDAVSVRGAVSLYGDTPQIALDVTDGLCRLPEKVVIASRKSVAEIGTGDVDHMVRVEGAIVDVQWISRGFKYTLDDGTGSISLILWQNLLDEMVDRADLSEGTWLDVRGVVSKYRGELELVPELALDVQIAQAQPVTVAQLPRVERRKIGDLGREDAGQGCEIEGQIVAVHPFSGGVHWTVDDGTGEIVVLVWQNVLAPLSMPFDVGTRVRVTGEVAVYKGTLEVIPAVPGDLVWLSASLAPTPKLTVTASLTGTPTGTAPVVMPIPTPTLTPVPPTPTPTPDVGIMSTGNVGSVPIGQGLAIQGQIVEAIGFSSGAKFYIDDGSGRVALWIPQDLYVQLPTVAQLVVGSAVRVAGKVAEYRGEIEVVPQAVGDVTMLVAATLPEVTAHMGDLTAADKGRLVTVEGEIVEVTPFAGSTSSQGIKYLLDDGSARITLLLWQSVYDVVPGKERLAVGASVRATGQVDEYRGELQIVPAVGGDVILR